MEEELQQAQNIYNVITDFLVNKGFEVVIAILIMAAGIYIARRVAGFLEGLLISRKIDITLSRFSGSGLKILIIGMFSLIALDKIGIPITPFVAVVGALSLGAGLALQGLLSNYGAGVSIIVSRPFVVGDTIAVQGVSGIVKEVHLANTVLSNEDEVSITIPNKHIVGEIIHNSKADSVIELGVGIAYDSDVDKALTSVLGAIKSVPGISSSRDPQVGIDAFGDSSINLGIRFWAKTEILFQVKYKVNKAIFDALSLNNIEIPFPQRHVHLFDENSYDDELHDDDPLEKSS